MNLPALRALAHANPGAQFTLVGYPSILALAGPFISIKATYSIDTPPWSGLFQGSLPGLAFDAAFVWMKNPVVADNLRKSGVSNVLYADPFPSGNIHAAAHLLNTICLPAPELPDLWTGKDSNLVLIHPGAGSPRKCWPFFEQLIVRVPNVTAIIGPAEEQFHGCCPQLRGFRLVDIAHEILRCRHFIGNDSGITHLASYLGCPAVALFGPTLPQIWGPVGRRVEILWKSSLSDIKPEEVIQRL